MEATFRQSILRQLSRSYYDLNGSHYDVLDRPPTALEFARLVNISRPVVIKGVNIPAFDKWTDHYLLQKMGNAPMSVAVTPNGQARADAITRGHNGLDYFVEPHSEVMTMADLMSKLKGDDATTEMPSQVYYLQSQNGNMYDSQFFEDGSGRTEYSPLRQDVPSEVPWCSEALGKHPDAVNVWIGDSRSVTSIHSDPYENIYTVIRGSKQFTLLPPTDGWCLEEREYPHATYTRSPSGELVITPSPEEMPHVRWSSIPEPHIAGNLDEAAHPIHISLEAGDTLYLPAGWWHHVRQGGSQGEVTIAMNWWYDVEMRGMSWVWLSFLRGTMVEDGDEEEANE